MTGREMAGTASRSRMIRVDFQTSHLRHLTIHEHDIIGAPFQGLDSLQTRCHDVDLTPHALEHTHSDFLVNRVIFGQENPPLQWQQVYGWKSMRLGAGGALCAEASEAVSRQL